MVKRVLTLRVKYKSDLETLVFQIAFKAQTGSHKANKTMHLNIDTHFPRFHYVMLYIDLLFQCLAAQITTLLLMPLRHLPMSVPRATCPGEFNINSDVYEYI